jgi:hypothetical protein
MTNLTALLLSVLMLLPMAVLPSFAAGENIILSGETLDAAVDAAAAALAGVPEGATYRVQSRVRQNAVAAKDLAKSFAGYIFVNPNKVEGISDAIANDADYTVTVMENGKKTVYIAVDLREHPEIANLDVLRAAVKKLDAKQQQAAAGESDVDLMSYQHIAGELALHVIVAAAMSAIGKDESDETLRSSMVANLNKDESRFPTQLIEFLGKFIMDYIIGTLNQYIGYFFK